MIVFIKNKESVPEHVRNQVGHLMSYKQDNKFVVKTYSSVTGFPITVLLDKNEFQKMEGENKTDV